MDGTFNPQGEVPAGRDSSSTSTIERYCFGPRGLRFPVPPAPWWTATS